MTAPQDPSFNDDTGESQVAAAAATPEAPAESKISNFNTDSSANLAASAAATSAPADQARTDSDATSDSEPYQRPAGSRAEFTTAFDIIDAMAGSLDEAKSPLFSPSSVKVDKREMLDYLDELKKVLPVQLERASALMRESERRLEAAQDQSDSIVRSAQRNGDEIIAKANEQADFLAGHQNVVALAEEKARDIISKAQAKADSVTQGANDYSATMLANLDSELDKLSRDVKGGLSLLRTREQEAAAKLHRIDGSDEENYS